MDGLPSRYPRQPWCLCLPMASADDVTLLAPEVCVLAGGRRVWRVYRPQQAGRSIADQVRRYEPKTAPQNFRRTAKRRDLRISSGGRAAR